MGYCLFVWASVINTKKIFITLIDLSLDMNFIKSYIIIFFSTHNKIIQNLLVNKIFFFSLEDDGVFSPGSAPACSVCCMWTRGTHVRYVYIYWPTYWCYGVTTRFMNDILIKELTTRTKKLYILNRCSKIFPYLPIFCDVLFHIW